MVALEEAGGRRGRGALVAGFLLAGFVFAIDPFVPLGVAFAVPYVVAVLLTLWSARKRDTLLVAVLCSVLTAVGYALSPDLGVGWQALSNRGLALVALWVTAGVCLARKRSEEDLRASRDLLAEREGRMRAILDTAADGIITIDERGTVKTLNPAAEQMFGYRADEVVGKNVRLLMPAPYAEEHDDYLERYLRDGRPRIIGLGREVLGRRKDGTTFPLDLGVGESRFGEGREFTGIVRDLSERKRLEREFLEAQKMEAVGRLAGGIAHDFNNLLMGITGCSRIAAKSVGDDAAVEDQLLEIQAAAQRGASLARQLLTFSRREKQELRPLSLNEVVTRSAAMLERLLSEDVDLELSLAESGAPVVGDDGRLEQVLMNLAANARLAMPGGGVLRITTRDLDPEASAPGGRVLLEVVDTGCGMDEATCTSAFEPFFTTREGGSGLGLSTVYGIAKAMGAEIGLESELGRGTTFRFLFPRAQGAVQSAAADEPGPEEAPATAAPERAVVLVVEDDRLVRAGVIHLLREEGYRVLVAGNGREALELGESEEAIDLLLSDVIMPGLSGADVARELQARRPDLKALFMSALPREVLVEQGRLVPGQPSIEKPFTEEVLRAKVREVLAIPPATERAGG